ncbi:MAG: ArsR family transcriptional regulator [Nitrososphaerota archaeon]|nr:ArsR family transcriptional regulator [Nitrososphaerota archaeon]
MKRSTRRRVERLAGANPSMRIRHMRQALQLIREDKGVRTLARWGMGLSGNTRMYILSLLKTYGDLTATELVAALDLSQPTVARHMRVLLGSRLVDERRTGKWTYYSLDPDAVGLVLGEVVRMTSMGHRPSDAISLSPLLLDRMDRLTHGQGEERTRHLRAMLLAVQDHDKRVLSRRLTRAISDRTRLEMLALMQMYGELTATELAAALNVSHAAVSQHMRLLAGFAKGTRRGRWIHYSVTNPSLARMLPTRLAPPSARNAIGSSGRCSGLRRIHPQARM